MIEEKSVLKLFVRKKSGECVLAKRVLKKNGTQFREIDVEEKGITAYLWRDLRTDKVPVLALPNRNIIGARAIAEFVRKGGKHVKK